MRQRRATDNKITPKHYTALTPEPITAIEGWSLDFCLGNAVKYISRAGSKEGETTLDDLRKARWYLDRRIAQIESDRSADKQLRIRGRARAADKSKANRDADKPNRSRRPRRNKSV